MGELPKNACQYCFKKRYVIGITKFNGEDWRVCGSCARNADMHFELLLEIPFNVTNPDNCYRIISWLIDFVDEDIYNLNTDIWKMAASDLLYFWIENQGVIAGSKCEILGDDLLESVEGVAEETKDSLLRCLIDQVYSN